MPVIGCIFEMGSGRGSGKGSGRGLGGVRVCFEKWRVRALCGERVSFFCFLLVNAAWPCLRFGTRVRAKHGVNPVGALGYG